MNPLLEIHNLSKTFKLHAQERSIVGCNNISFSMNSGDFIGITGKSGSGKSTVLKMIYRTYLPQEGEIFYESLLWGKVSLSTLDEQKILYLRKKEIGYVSQFLHVIPRTTAREIIENAVLESGGLPDEAHVEAVRMLQHFELAESLWDSYPQTFSGGEKLRLNIARAMVKHPRLLLLDEPTASLDSSSKQKVRVLIEQLKNEGTTMLGIFHDLEFMEGLCDREYAMSSGKAAQT